MNTANVHVSDSIKHCYLTFGQKIFDYDLLNQLIGEVLWEEKDQVAVLRMKGIFHTSQSENITSLQAVQETFELADSGMVWSEGLENKVLVVYEVVQSTNDRFESELEKRMSRAIKE